MKLDLIIFLKGLLMGICDIIPGISGGTIAFITGIYERLINAVRAFSPELVGSIFSYMGKRDKQSLSLLKDSFKKLDLVFLITLFSGVGISLLAGSRIVKYLLEQHYLYTISFFIGLILASSKTIFDHIKNHKPKNIAFGVLGLAFGVLLAVLIPAKIVPSLPYIFIGGFVAISAMFLPGISGAFILLIMGLYEHILDMAHDIIGNLVSLSVFGVGAILGAFSISRFVSFLFKKDKCKTLYVLLGLVIGCLSIPINKVFNITSSWNILNIMVASGLLVLGIFLTSRVSKLEGKNV